MALEIQAEDPLSGMSLSEQLEAVRTGKKTKETIPELGDIGKLPEPTGKKPTKEQFMSRWSIMMATGMFQEAQEYYDKWYRVLWPKK